LHCAALNHRDIWIQKGIYHVLKYPVVPGADGAGVVIATGETVDADLIGHEVIINPGLSWGDREERAGPDFYPLGSPQGFDVIIDSATQHPGNQDGLSPRFRSDAAVGGIIRAAARRGPDVATVARQ